MRIGQTVPLYENMDICTEFIGFGTLLKCTFQNETLETWIVQEKSGQERQYAFHGKSLKKRHKKD